MTTSDSRCSISLTDRVLPEGRARLIASECPLTWRQVQEVAREAGSARWAETLRLWMARDDPSEVATFIWGLWTQRATQ